MKNAHMVQFTVSTAVAAALGFLAQPAGADTIRLSQGFDDTAVFDASDTTTTTLRGDSGTTGGAWNFYSGGSATPRIINDGSDADAAYTGPVFSGTQSAAIVRVSSTFTGRVSSGIAAGEDYEMSFRVFRGADASFVFNPTAFGGGASEGSAFLEDDGRLLIRNGANTAWVDTGLDIAEGDWTLVRYIVDRDAGQYTLSVTPDGGAEAFSSVTPDLFGSVAVGQVNFTTQAPTGNISYLDDIQLIEGDRVIPEPATLGLLGIAGLLLVRRR